MKLYLDLDNYDYQPERYKYAVEQMMLTLFPEERPEYPPREGRTLKGETNAARFTLRRSPVWTTVRAQVYRPQGMGQAAVRVGSGELDRPPEQVYHTLQHALKMAFYQAGTALLGGEPLWGALTGVRPVKLPTRAMLAGATEAQACRELEREYREMAAVIPRAEVCMFAHGGHPAIASNAEEAARVITGFFSAHPAQLP